MERKSLTSRGGHSPTNNFSPSLSSPLVSLHDSSYLKRQQAKRFFHRLKAPKGSPSSSLSLSFGIKYTRRGRRNAYIDSSRDGRWFFNPRNAATGVCFVSSKFIKPFLSLLSVSERPLLFSQIGRLRFGMSFSRPGGLVRPFCLPPLSARDL